MKYIMAESIEEILTALQDAKGSAKLIAGGTDLVLDIADEKYTPQVLVDITRVPKLCEVRVDGADLVLGGAVTHGQAARHPLIRRWAPALANACASVGSLQIRNVATLAGNVVNAQPAADAAVALAALGAVYVVDGENGQQRLPMQDMYRGFGKSAVDSTKELIREIRVPCQREGEASAFIRLELRKALALPMLNLAAMARVEDGMVAWARIAMAPVGIGPVRAKSAEEAIAGRPLTGKTINQVAPLVLEQANPRSNPLRGTREYRMQVLPVLAARALRQIGTQLDTIRQEENA